MKCDQTTPVKFVHIYCEILSKTLFVSLLLFPSIAVSTDEKYKEQAI